MEETMSQNRDDAAYAARAPEVEAFLAKPQSTGALKVWGARNGLGSHTAEDIALWLELQGRVRTFKAFDGKKRFVVAGAAAEERDERTTSGSSTSDEAPKQEAPKETNVAKDIVSKPEAAKMLGCSTQNVGQLAKRGRLKQQGDGYTRASIEAWRDRKKGAAPVDDKPTTRKSVKPPPETGSCAAENRRARRQATEERRASRRAGARPRRRRRHGSPHRRRCVVGRRQPRALAHG